MNQIPLLFLGDSPSVAGGLSRIGRDIALIASRMEEFRVGFLGRGGMPSSSLPFMQYTFPEMDQWGENWLQPVWEDFSKGEKGIVMTIWDPSRLLWLANPMGMPNEKWLRARHFQKWGYFPIDAEGPDGRLSITGIAALAGFDRHLAYGLFGSSVISGSLGTSAAIDFLPHGINMEVFQPREGKGVKVGMALPKDCMMLGVVMTNQARKDWALAMDVIARVAQKVPELKVWCKTDSIDRHWDMRALVTDFKVWDNVVLDMTPLTDTDMSYMYSACDLTFLPSLGEGFGYPIVESLACGTPCLHGNYAGGAELVPDLHWLIDPITYRYETRHNCKRPVFNPQDWADAIVEQLALPKPTELCRSSVSYLNWPALHTSWQKWFREGLK
jgi:glycosyltransferase involved in cell wall biosynthesis